MTLPTLADIEQLAAARGLLLRLQVLAKLYLEQTQFHLLGQGLEKHQ